MSPTAGCDGEQGSSNGYRVLRTTFTPLEASFEKDRSHSRNQLHLRVITLEP